VKKNGVPDLTMVDIPGITRVPVHDQPDNIYDQIKDIIMDYITPEDSIILNVLPATVDFTTCESIRL
jgi:replication fork clamp-binding protein CrfC